MIFLPNSDGIFFLVIIKKNMNAMKTSQKGEKNISKKNVRFFRTFFHHKTRVSEALWKNLSLKIPL